MDRLCFWPLNLPSSPRASRSVLMTRAAVLFVFLAHAAALSVVPPRAPRKTLIRSLSLPIVINGQTTMLRAAEGQQVADVAAEFLITHGVTGDDYDALLPALEGSLAARGCRNGRLARLMEDTNREAQSASG